MLILIFSFQTMVEVMTLLSAAGSEGIYEYFNALWLSMSVYCNCVCMYETVAHQG